MSAGSVPGAGGGGKEQSQDFELNITSIIDTFTVLITFMLASASFIAIGIFDAGISAAGAAPTDSKDKPPSVSVEISLAMDHSYTVKLTGKVTSSTPVPAKNKEYDLEGLAAQLNGVKTRFSDVQAATLIAENRVEYKDVIRTMEQTKKTLPFVLLGGF
jgi:biopolymer transport protein ExbD